ncbi:hypothetical protein [Mycolicibacterium iranicum]|uniref:hypothetical protein n=1 Tax=Mycolicibacterium iranicum TaxID=912594 RepID=UPI0004678929|nr:hypothetical protein [Mycolicibacterium iranicum]
MNAIAKLAVIGAALGALTTAGAGAAYAATSQAEAPRSVIISTDDIDDLVAPWLGHTVALDDDWDDDDWDDDDWDDDGWDD